MNIWEVSNMLKDNPGMVARSKDEKLGFEIFFDLDKQVIRHTKHEVPLKLVPNVINTKWEIKDQEVDFMTAFNAWQSDDKYIYSKSEDDINGYNPKEKGTAILPAEIRECKWYIRYK